MNKEVIAGMILMVIWVSLMLVWGASNNVIPDLRNYTADNPNNDCEIEYGLGGAFCK